MKNLILTAAMGAVCLGATAQMESPTFYSAPLTEASELTSAWITYGVADEPSSNFIDYFKNYKEGPWYNVLTFGDVTAAYSLSEFNTAAPSDQWLITPEFEVPDDYAILTYNVITYGNKLKNGYKIYLSESGTSKEDFKKTQLLSRNVTGQIPSEAKSETYRAVVNGYKGKKVRLAFVNEGNQRGVLGFNDIAVGPYYISVDNLDKVISYVIDKDDPKMTVTVRMSAPQECRGITAELKSGDKVLGTFSNTMKINNNNFSRIDIKFPENIDMGGELNIPYTLTIRLNNPAGTEEYPATVINGTFYEAGAIYENPAVVEELTGTWCPNCPAGTARLEWLNGTFGSDKVIGIAVHNGDPMDITEYSTPLINDCSRLGSVGLPFMAGNRATGGHPLYYTAEDQIGVKSVAKAEIKEVVYNPEGSGPMNVTFDVRLSYGTTSPGLNYSFVVIENNVKGTDTNYNQKNIYANNPHGATGTYLEYLQKFVDQPSIIPYTKIEYEEVARCIVPSFNGEPLSGNFTYDSPVSFKYSMTMPKTVNNPDNTELVLIVRDPATGHIVAANKMPAAKFVRGSGVNEVNDEGKVVIRSRNGGVYVYADSVGEVSVYSLDGKKLLSTAVSEGENLFRIDGFHGMAIVKVATENGNSTSKVML